MTLCSDSRAAGLSSQDIAAPHLRRNRSASPLHKSLEGALPTGAAAEVPVTSKRHFPGVGVGGQDVVRPVGLSRDRGLLDRPVSSPVLLSKRPYSPNVLAPWCSGTGKQVAMCCEEPQVLNSSPTRTAKRSAESTFTVPASCSERAAVLRTSNALKLGLPVDYVMHKGVGFCAPVRQAALFDSECGVLSGGLRSCHSLPPESFRFEIPATLLASRVTKSAERLAAAKVGAAGAAPHGHISKQVVEDSIAISQAYPECLRHQPTPTFQMQSKTNGSRLSLQDLRTIIATSNDLAPLSTLSPATSSVIRRNSAEGYFGVAGGKLIAAPRLESVPTSAGVSRHTSATSFRSSTTSLLKEAATIKTNSVIKPPTAC